ncbi:MAG: (Fe-S)-binding protein [Promethearchaeia archaeon]
MEPEKYDKMIKQCIRCSICKWIPQVQIKSRQFATICPAIDMYNFHPYSGGGKIILALALELNKIEPSADLLDIVYKCTGCGGCAISCKYLNDLEPLEIISTLREKLVRSNKGPMQEQGKYIRSVREVNNPYGEPVNERLLWKSQDIEIDTDAKILYFVGCTSSYRTKKIAQATAKILNFADVDFQIINEEICCGSPLLRVGEKEAFLECLDQNLNKIEEMGIDTVIFSCAGCYDTFKVDYYRERKYDFQVVHSVTFFNQLIEEGKLNLKNKIPLKTTYHDPCHLGRNAERYKEWKGEIVDIMPLVSIESPKKPKRVGQNGIYDAPRKILEAIPELDLVEMERIREYAYCCGAGGGVKAAFPEFAVNTAQTRIEEAESTSADILVSACPFCTRNLKDGISESQSNLQFFDISELLLMAINEKELMDRLGDKI